MGKIQPKDELCLDPFLVRLYNGESETGKIRQNYIQNNGVNNFKKTNRIKIFIYSSLYAIIRNPNFKNSSFLFSLYVQSFLYFSLKFSVDVKISASN